MFCEISNLKFWILKFARKSSKTKVPNQNFQDKIKIWEFDFVESRNQAPGPILQRCKNDLLLIFEFFLKFKH